MSLLMDALKKAEAAKRQASQHDEHDADERPSAVEPGSPLPELPRELSLLDDQFQGPHAANPGAASSRAPASTASSESQREREAAHNLFAAKRSPSRAPFWIGVALSTIVATGAIGTWFWWQLQPRAGGVQPGPALTQAPTPPRTAAPELAGTPPQSAPATTGTPFPQVPTTVAPAASGSNTVNSRARPSVSAGTTTGTRRAPAEPSRDATRIGHLGDGAPPEKPEASIGVRAQRSPALRDNVNPAVARGYAAYSSGDLESAKRHYEEALRSDPRSLDALNGVAAIALRAGRRDVAESYLSRALEIDPKDAYALATLTSLRSHADAPSSESRFKSLIAATPDSPVAHFGLGNLYAREGRWSEAQQAYFRAFSAEPDNPDFLFNLAVSLDHLRQPKLARQYYQSALDSPRQGAFDRERAGARVRELEQATR